MRKIILGIIVAITCQTMTAEAFLFEKQQPPVYLTAEELAIYNGKEGQRLSVSVDGKIYDLTKFRYWKEDIHEKSPEAAIGGRDLTEVRTALRHGLKRVQRDPHAGFLMESKEDIPVESNAE